MEEISKKELNKRQKRSLKDSGTDITLRVLAFAIAVIIWFILSITQYPTINKTIKDIHVTFSMEGTAAQEKGLDALNYKDITVDVEIKGMNYEIGTYDQNDLIATVNLDKVTKEGKYKLDIDVKSAHPTDRCSVVSVTPAYVDVDFDRITTKTLPVTVDAPMITAEEKFTLKDHSANPAEITIQGPQNELEKIDKVVASISASRKLTEDETIDVESLVLYNSNGTRVDTTNLNFAKASDYSVDFVVYKQKLINLKVDITSVPDGFDVNSLPMVLSNESISLITPKLDDKDTDTVTIGSIPLSDIDLSKHFNFTVNLAPGEINTTGANNITVSFDKEGYSSAKFEISADRITLIDAPKDLETSIDTEVLPSVTIFGPTEVIEQLEDENITARIDLGSIRKTGSYNRDAVIHIEGFNNVWCFGTNQVQVTVSEKVDESEDEEGSEVGSEDEEGSETE